MLRLLVGLIVANAVASAAADPSPTASLTYPTVDTGQTRCYDDRSETGWPAAGQPHHGQDAQYAGHQPDYVDHGDGIDPDPRSRNADGIQPFIDTRYFQFRYGDTAAGERIIDSQTSRIQG